MAGGYPAGAGPNAGAFTGEVWNPSTSPAQGLDGTPAQVSRPQVASADAVVSGGLTVATFTAPTTTAWLVRRIVVQSNTFGTAFVYVGTIDPDNIVSGTFSGDFDENDANQPYLVPEGVSMRIVWASGGICQARIEYVEV